MIQRGLSRQLFGYFLIIIVVSLTAVGAVTYWQSSKQLDRQLERYMTQMTTHAAYQTDLYLKTYERASMAVVLDTNVMRFIEMNPKDSYMYYAYNDQIQHQVLESILILYPQIDTISILGSHGRSIHSRELFRVGEPVIDSASVYNELNRRVPEDGTSVILGEILPNAGGSSIITMARKIRGITTHDTRGIMAMRIGTSEISKLWGQLDIGEAGYSFIVDGTGSFIDKPSGVNENQLVNAGVLDRLLMGDTSFTASVHGESRMFVAKKLEMADWRMVISVPVSELRQPILNIQYTTVMVGMITLVFAIWLSWHFRSMIVRPFQNLVKGMREAEKGNWIQIEESYRQNEFGYLVKSYNLMIRRLSEMIERVYEAELKSQKNELELQEITIERQRAEFQALQLQINPHFLYNTLETIKSYAVVQDSEEIREMVEAMAAMLRYSIGTNLGEITVANELKHVLNYMTILQHRSLRKFELDVQISAQFLLHKMVRLTLQPLVENVFQHAFPQGIEEHHYIRIDAAMEDGCFKIYVEDNGAGMTEEQVRELRTKLELNQLAEADSGAVHHSGGIGLMNVHRRIQMVYGERYGLTVESELGVGTRMIMSLPS